MLYGDAAMKRMLSFAVAAIAVMSLCSCSLIDQSEPAASTLTLKSPEELQGHFTEAITDISAEDDLTHVIYSDSYEASSVRKFILDVVFGPNHNGEVDRWKNEISYYVTGKPSREDLEAVKYLTKAFADIENYPNVKEAKSEAGANLIINYTDYDEFNVSSSTTVFSQQPELTTEPDAEFSNVKSTRTITCNKASGEIFKASIKLAVADAGKKERRNALAMELMRVSGMLYFSDVYSDSILSYSSVGTRTEPSEIDYLAISLFYDSNIRSGSPYTECFVALDRLLCGETTTDNN